jgi:hypothetical protein
MLTRFSSWCWQHRSNCSKQWDGETRNCALKDFCFDFYLEVFSGVLLQTRMCFEIIQTRSNDFSYRSERVEELNLFINRNRLEKSWSESESCWQGDKEHSEFRLRDKKSQWLVRSKNLLPQIVLWNNRHCERALTSQFAEILKLKFVLLLDFGNFKHRS